MKILVIDHHFAFDGNFTTVLEMSDDVDSEKAVEEWMPRYIDEVVPADEAVEFYIDSVIELTGENIQWKSTNITGNYEREYDETRG